MKNTFINPSLHKTARIRHFNRSTIDHIFLGWKCLLSSVENAGGPNILSTTPFQSHTTRRLNTDLYDFFKHCLEITNKTLRLCLVHRFRTICFIYHSYDVRNCYKLVLWRPQKFFERTPGATIPHRSLAAFCSPQQRKNVTSSLSCFLYNGNKYVNDVGHKI